MKILKRIFVKIIMVAIACMFIMPYAIGAESNLPLTEIGDYGNWMTDDNMAQFNMAIGTDMVEFQSGFQNAQSVPDYVPIEAKIGLALINAMSVIADILDASLVRFAIIFMIIAYVFWLIFETYNMMTKGTSAMDLGENLVKKGAVIAIWSIILAFGPAQLFMWIMGPIIRIGTYLSDLILNAVSNTIGLQIPDTCGAIHAYTAQHVSENMILDAEATANILCVPTRLSGFFTTAISIGWKWMISGIGHSAFTMLVGLIFIVVFVYNAFKFALMGLGVIIDLFLGVAMLPFTAIAETINQTSYKGIVGDIYNGFLGLFKPESLSKQISRFTDAAIYFVSLSIVIALCAALLSGTISVDASASVPTLENSGFMITLLTGILVAYLASRANEIAENLGGKIDKTFSQQFSNDIKKVWGNVTKQGKDIIKTIRKKD